MPRVALAITAILLFASCGGNYSEPARDVPAGVSPAVWHQLTTELSVQLGKRASLNFQPHLALDEYTTVDDLMVTPLADGYMLEWSYRNFGDYNQDGEVNFSDLAKIGQYLGEATSSPNWDMASIADGDGNGIVGMEDITPLAANWRGCVSAYLIAPDLGDSDGNALISVSDLTGIGALFLNPENGFVGLYPRSNETGLLRFIGPEGDDFNTNVTAGTPGLTGPWEGFFAQPIKTGTFGTNGRRRQSCRLTYYSSKFAGWTVGVAPLFDDGQHHDGGAYAYSMSWDWSTVGELGNLITLPQLAQ